VNPRRTTLLAIDLLVAAAAITFLAGAMWPGFGNGCWVCLAMPLAGVVGCVWLWAVVQRPRAQADRLSARRLFVAPAVIVVTAALLYFHIPLRLAFAAARSGFEPHVATAPLAPESSIPRAPLGKISIYRVDVYAADPRGGVYFRTGWGQDGMGPDRMSFGFAYRPNATGTPFGRARYRIGHLGGEWYWFMASDDY
jgi:hypothetical protein